MPAAKTNFDNLEVIWSDKESYCKKKGGKVYFFSQRDHKPLRGDEKDKAKKRYEARNEPKLPKVYSNLSMRHVQPSQSKSKPTSKSE